jgi:hypothetical protein
METVIKSGRWNVHLRATLRSRRVLTASSQALRRSSSLYQISIKEERNGEKMKIIGKELVELWAFDIGGWL